MVDHRGILEFQRSLIEITKYRLKYQGYENDDDWGRGSRLMSCIYIPHELAPKNVNHKFDLDSRGPTGSALKCWIDELSRIIDKPPELLEWIPGRKDVPYLGDRPTSITRCRSYSSRCIRTLHLFN